MSAASGGDGLDRGRSGRDGGSDGQLQPGDPRDLRRYPPASDACLEIRARLRDFLDGELPSRQAASLERHVHECRSCALALSRAELEVLRLRKSFEEERRQLEELPPGLTASILEALEPEHFAAFGRSSVDDDDLDVGFDDDVFEGSDEPEATRASSDSRAAGSRGADGGRRPRRERGALDGWAVLDGEFTGRVMARVRREWQPSGPWARLGRRMAEHRTVTFAVAGLLVVVLAGLAWFALHGAGSGVATADGLLVAEAQRARRTVGSGLGEGTGGDAERGVASSGPSAAVADVAGARRGWLDLAVGDGLPVGTAFSVGPAGRLTLVDGRRYVATTDAARVERDAGDAARPLDADDRDPLRLEFLGDGLGRFFDHASLASAGLPWRSVGAAELPELPEGPVLDLDHGTLDLSLSSSRGRPLPVSLGGFAWLVADPDSDISLSLLEVARADPAVGAEGSLTGRVEVLSGRAELWLGVRRETVSAGTVARFDPLGALTLEPSAGTLLDDSRDQGTRRGRSFPMARLVDPAAWSGLVVRAGTLAPVVGAEVRIAVGPGEHQVQHRLTDDEGRFAFVLDGPAVPMAVLSIAPGPADRDLGIEPARYVALGEFNGRERQLGTIELQVGREVVGAVRDGGLPVEGVEVRAMVVDQVFGLVDALGDVSTRSDAAGEFRLVGLPQELQPHESLVVFVPQQDGKIPVAAAEVAWRSQPGGLPIERSRRVDVDVPAARDVALVDLPTEPGLTIFQAIPGIPVTAMAMTLPVRRDADGTAHLRNVGPGALYAVDRSGGRVIHLVASGVPADPDRLVCGSEAGFDFANRIDRLRKATAEEIGEVREVALWSSRGYRMLSPYAPRSQPGGSKRPPCYLTVAHSSKLVAQPANLYIEFRDGRVEFLGVYDGGPSLAFDLPTERPFWLIAIGRDSGAVGVVEIGEGTTDVPAVVEVASPGELDLTAVLGPSRHGLCAFRLLDGPLAGRTFWRSLGSGDQGVVGDLPPGRYRVELGDGTSLDCEVEAGARVQAKPDHQVDVEAPRSSGRGD